MSDFPDRLRRLPDDMVAALSFFSCLPVDPPRGRFDLRQSTGGWPLAGLLLAVAPAAVVVITAWLGIPLLVGAFLAIAASVAMTGAMHEDGLADTLDGLGARGNIEKRLSVMRDSRLGTFGALALLLTLAVRGTALAALAGDPADAVLALFGVAIVSRSFALWHWTSLPPARGDGVAFSAGQPDGAALQLGLLSGLLAAVALTLIFGWAAILGLLLALAALGLVSSLARRMFAGHTGDTIGAAQQVAEVALLAGLSAAATGFA